MNETTARVQTTVVEPATRTPPPQEIGEYVLILDDGGTLALTAHLLIGREPATHPDVRSGVRRGLLLIDETNALSRHHLALSVDGGGIDVTDLGSANGTMIVDNSTGESSPLVPRRATRLAIGDRVHVGARSFQLGYRHG